jgi:hypothetical protein
MAFSNRAIDGEPKSPSPPAVELKTPWRRYCGSGQLFGSDDPSGKWRKLFKKQEEYDLQLKKLTNLTQDFTRRAIVQVRRERLLKTRRDTHDMFKAHCDACRAPPRPEIGSFDSLRKGKLQTPLAQTENPEKTLPTLRETVPSVPTPPVRAKLPPGLQAAPGLAFLTSVDELERMLATEFQRQETPMEVPRSDDSSDDDADGVAGADEKVPWAAADAELRQQAMIARRGPMLTNSLPTNPRQQGNQKPHSQIEERSAEGREPRLFSHSPQPPNETRSTAAKSLAGTQQAMSYTLADTHHHDDFTVFHARVGKAAPQRSVAEHLSRAAMLSHRRPTAESSRVLFQAHVPSPPVYVQPISSSASAAATFQRTRRPMTAR